MSRKEEGKQVPPAAQFPCLLIPGILLASDFLEPGCQRPPAGVSGDSTIAFSDTEFGQDLPLKPQKEIHTPRGANCLLISICVGSRGLTSSSEVLVKGRAGAPGPLP